jgi:hypothetical protein
MKTARWLASLLLLASSATAGNVVLFKGPLAGEGDVMVVTPATGAWYVPIGLDRVQLLGIDVNGRSELERFLPGKAWLETDVPSARVVLPQRRGSIYHYRRDMPGDGSLFGYFVVDPNGDAWPTYELQGTGLAFSDDPFLPRVAIAPDGQAMLVATTAAAGGDLIEVFLAPNGGFFSRTDLAPPLVIHEESLRLQSAWGVAATQTGILRFPRPSVASATPLTYSGSPPTWWTGELAVSGNGAFAAAIASSSAPLGDVWVFGATGPARRTSESAMPLSGAGFLPEANHGPYLAVSDDGLAAAWRIEGTTREGFLAKVVPPVGQVPQQVSSDEWFDDTLDELGHYRFKPGSRSLVLAVGAASAVVPPDLESADFFSVELDDAGKPQFTNITLTNGVAQPPFLVTPELDPVSVSWTPAQDAVLFHDDQGGDQGQLVYFNPGQTGLKPLLDDVEELRRIDRVGGDLVAVMRRSTGNKDVELRVLDLQTMTSGPAFLTAPGVDEFPARAVRTDAVYAFVQRTPNLDWMWAFDTRTGTLAKMTPRKLLYGPGLAVNDDGEMGFAVGAPGVVNTFAWWLYPDAPKRLPIAPVVGFMLPGI